jgi:RNA polymerase sigma-70 factor (ECF subfamily)
METHRFRVVRGVAGSDEDRVLIARVAGRAPEAGDALAALFDRHAPILLGLLHRLLGGGGEAEEALQDVFVQAWRDAGRYRPELVGVRGWLVLLARSRALDRLRATGARRRREDRLVREAGEPWESPRGAERLERAQAERRLARALAALPAEQRQAIELAFFAGLTHAEVADRVGAPLGTVKSRILLGLRKLRSALAERDRPARRRAPAAA